MSTGSFASTGICAKGDHGNDTTESCDDCIVSIGGRGGATVGSCGDSITGGGATAGSCSV